MPSRLNSPFPTRCVLSTSVVLIAGSLALGQVRAAQLEWTGDFEEGMASIADTNGADFHKKLYEEGIQASADVQPNSGMGICGSTRAGNYSGRTQILDGGSGVKVRAEIKTNTPGVYKFMWDGPEYWVGVSLCLAEWPTGSDVHTFLQVHAPNEAAGSTCDFAGNALSIEISGDTAHIRVIDNPSGVSAGKGAFSNSKIVYSYNLRSTMGQWQDFVFRFHLSTTGDGYYTAWHNGNQVASESGLVNVNWKDSCGNVIPKAYSNGLHLGMYGGPNTAGPKMIYIDEARIAVGPDGYNLVVPGGEGGSKVVRPNPPSSLQTTP